LACPSGRFAGVKLCFQLPLERAMELRESWRSEDWRKMLYAIVENGGKQYRAEEGSHIEIDLLKDEIGKKKTFKQVLLLDDGENVQVGTPYLTGVSIDTTVVNHFKGPKITVFKYRAKQRYRVKTGHRQRYTRVLVDSIAYPGKSKSTPETTPEKVEKEPTREKKKPKAPQKKVEAKTPKAEPKKPATAKPKAKQPAAKKEQPAAPSTRKNIKSLELRARTSKSLLDAGISTVGQLLKKLESGESEMVKISGIGEKSLDEILKNLKKFGYK